MSVIINPKELKIRILECKITLQSGQFNPGNNTITVRGDSEFNSSTITASVHKTLSNNFTNSANITIYGLNESDIAALSTTGYAPLILYLNNIELYAQYEEQQKSLCFKGFIVRAWADYSDPSRPMHFECQTTYLNAITSVAATSIKGSIAVPDLYNKFASSLQVPLQNNGVTGILNNPVLIGSLIEQLKYLSNMTQTNCLIDNGIMKISPFRTSLTNQILNINSDSGLLSYPTIDSYGVRLRIRYDPTLQIGQYINLQTVVNIPKATGSWYVYDMQSNLNNNHDYWYTDLKCSYNNLNFG